MWTISADLLLATVDVDNRTRRRHCPLTLPTLDCYRDSMDSEIDTTPASFEAITQIAKLLVDHAEEVLSSSPDTPA